LLFGAQPFSAMYKVHWKRRKLASVALECMEKAARGLW